MDRFTYVALLYDFYGSLLTAKQKRIVEMHFMNDMSLSEIGAELGISRQAAGILINRTEKNLDRYESALGLVGKYLDGREKAEEAVSVLRRMRGLADREDKAKIDNIINDILEEYPGGI